jgi:phage/plasmid-like protein (TIGR03299 family)
MAHQININKVTSQASFFSAREVAWHKLGKVVDNSLTSEEAILAAGLNYEVHKVDMYADFRELPITNNPDVDKQRGQVVPNIFATVRTDTRQVLGYVGNRYEIVQNSQAFDFVDNIVGSKEAIFETAGALGNGERIFLTAKLPSNIRIKATDDIIEMYFLFTSSHDGSGLITAGLTPVRVVCNNTLQVALRNLSNKLTLKHTKNVHERLKLGRELMGLYKAYNLEFSETLSHLATIPVTDEIITSVVQDIIFTDAEKKIIKFDSVWSKELSTRKKNTYVDILSYVDKGVGQEFHRGTGVWLYNGVSSYFNNFKNYKNEEDRFDQLVSGKPMKDTQTVFNKLLQLT